MTEHRTPTLFVPALPRLSRLRDESDSGPGASELAELLVASIPDLTQIDLVFYRRVQARRASVRCRQPRGEGQGTAAWQKKLPFPRVN